MGVKHALLILETLGAPASFRACPTANPCRTISHALDRSPFTQALLIEFFRFAVLLTGDARTAEASLADTLRDVHARLGQLRHPEQRQEWALTRLRQHCLAADPSPRGDAPRLMREPDESGAPPEVLGIEAFIFAQRFHSLPEPERSALALFYLDTFPLAQIAKLLDLRIPEVGPVLGRARELLQAAVGTQSLAETSAS